MRMLNYLQLNYSVIHKGWDCKDNPKLDFSICIQSSILMIYWMIKHKIKPVLIYNEPWMQGNGRKKFHTIVSEVSSFVGNPVVILTISVNLI